MGRKCWNEKIKHFRKLEVCISEYESILPIYCILEAQIIRDNHLGISVSASMYAEYRNWSVLLYDLPNT